MPAEKAQLEEVEGDKKAYDSKLRPGLMVETMKQLQDAGVEPDVWKIEGLDRRDDCERIVETVRAGGRESVGCIVLGRGADEQTSAQWLKTVVPGFIGFAVGRTDFWQPLVDWRSKGFARDCSHRDCERIPRIRG